MKCEKCGAEASVYFSSTGNGHHEEHCLCADCAREAGLTEGLEALERLEGLDSGSGAPSGVAGGLLGGLLGLLSSGLLAGMLGLSDREDREEPEGRRDFLRLSAAEAAIPADAGAEVRVRREMAALRQELEQAAADEEYERAAVLRDRLRELEAQSV